MTIFLIILYYTIIYEYFNYYYKKRLRFLKKYKRIYNEFNITTFEDKINWLCIHDVNQLKGKCADKILLHEYSINKLGKDICNKIIKIYDNEKQLNFEELPEKFVLKANHGSGFNLIIQNKTELNVENVKNLARKWMRTDYGKKNAEFHYSFIKRKLFVEEFIGNNLKNYKFLCYNGKPKYIYVSIEENHNKYRNFYNMNWTFLDFHCLSEPHPTNNYKKPKLFEIMKEYAIKLSAVFRFVRVDFYELENEIRLGELTFTPMDSFFNCKKKEHEIELGKDININ